MNDTYSYFDNKINSLENEKKELKEQNKLITEQFNELKKQKKYTLVATVGIGVLLVWIMWQYKWNSHMRLVVTKKKMDFIVH